VSSPHTQGELRANTLQPRRANQPGDWVRHLFPHLRVENTNVPADGRHCMELVLRSKKDGSTMWLTTRASSSRNTASIPSKQRDLEGNQFFASFQDHKIMTSRSFSSRIRTLLLSGTSKRTFDVLLLHQLDFANVVVRRTQPLRLPHTHKVRSIIVVGRRLKLTLLCDFEGVRQGNRVVSLAEKPYLDPNSVSRREALAARSKV
jgi:hypothetical protein